MANVTITAGTYRNEPFNGEYKLMKGFTPFTTKPGGQLTVWSDEIGKQVRVTVLDHSDYAINGGTAIEDYVAPEVVPAQTVEEMDAQIRERFEIQTELVDGVIEGHITSLIIAGAAGVGKSFTVFQKLEEAVANGYIESMKILKGRTTAVALFEMLEQNKESGQIVVLDDIDSIFQDENALNILKAALDSCDVREISWNTANNSEGFIYEGQIIFITNLDFDKMMLKGSRLSPHYAALLSRSLYLDLKVHSKAEIMVRINQVTSETDMLDKLHIDQDQRADMMAWIAANVDTMRELSLRTVNKIAGMMQTSDDWARMARVTLLK